MGFLSQLGELSKCAETVNLFKVNKHMHSRRRTPSFPTFLLCKLWILSLHISSNFTLIAVWAWRFARTKLDRESFPKKPAKIEMVINPSLHIRSRHIRGVLLNWECELGPSETLLVGAWENWILLNVVTVPLFKQVSFKCVFVKSSAQPGDVAHFFCMPQLCWY